MTNSHLPMPKMPPGKSRVSPACKMHRLCLALASLCAAGNLQAQSTTEPVIGFSEPVETIEISAAETGVVQQMHVKEGDAVKAGQLLGRLDTRVLQASLRIAEIKAQSQAAIQSAKTRRDLRQSRLRKLEQLASSNSANPEELERARADMQVAEAEFQTAQDEARTSALEVERIAQSIESRVFRSPIDGVVTRVLRDVAEIVDTRTDHVITVVNLDRLRIVIYVPPQTAMQLRAGDQVPVRWIDGENVELKAAVEFVSPVTEPASGTVRVKLLVENPGGRLISGTKFAVTLPKNATAAR